MAFALELQGCYEPTGLEQCQAAYVGIVVMADE